MRTGSRCGRCGGKPTAEARRVDRALRTQAVAAWLAERGAWCPGWGRDGHAVEARELTADHDPPGVPVESWEDLGVLCRSCNSRKGASGGGGW